MHVLELHHVRKPLIEKEDVVIDEQVNESEEERRVAGLHVSECLLTEHHELRPLTRDLPQLLHDLVPVAATQPI